MTGKIDKRGELAVLHKPLPPGAADQAGDDNSGGAYVARDVAILMCNILKLCLCDFLASLPFTPQKSKVKLSLLARQLKHVLMGSSNSRIKLFIYR